MFIIANWKENKTVDEASAWIDVFSKEHELIEKLKRKPELQIVIAPSISLLYSIHEMLSKKGLFTLIKLSSQNVSQYQEGSHTGETAVSQLSKIIDYSIVGHSERRKIGETTEEVVEKIKRLLEESVTPIVCFSNIKEYEKVKNQFSQENIFYAYEPIDAIGSGKPADLDDVKSVFEKTGLSKIIYGGSVDKNSVRTYLDESFINGFLVGTASLNVNDFVDLIKVIITH